MRRQDRSLDAFRSLRCEASQATPALGVACADLPTNPTDAQIAACIRPNAEAVLGAIDGLAPLAPNIVLVITDDQHPMAVQFMPTVLSEIANRGISFDNAFTTTPVCAPSRAGILTGQHPNRHGVISNQELLDDSSTLATWLQAASYRTALIGKYLNLYGTISPTVPSGWTDWRAIVDETDAFSDYTLNENGTEVAYGGLPFDYSTDVLRDHAVNFVRSNSNQPFFLHFSPFAPHLPSEPAVRHHDSFDGIAPWRPPNWGEADISDKPGWLKFFSIPLAVLPSRDIVRQRQIETLQAADEAIAAILAEVEAQGLTDNTVVVFTADHGTHWGEHRWFTKHTPYEESIRIPMILRYPLMSTRVSQRSEIVANLDLAPTLADLAGVTPGHVVDGQSLLDILEGTGPWREDLLIQQLTSQIVSTPWDALRTEDTKYVRQQNGFEELYDLSADPFELESLSDDPPSAPHLAAAQIRLDELLAGLP